MSSRIITYVSPEHNPLQRLCINTLEVLTGRNYLEKCYQEIKATNPTVTEIWSMALTKLQISLAYEAEKLAQIPSDGPLVLLANHPFGVVDGLALAALALQCRPHFRFPVNSVLFKDELLNQFLLPIDFSPTRQAQRTNIRTKQLILEELKNEGTLLIFPAGGVATAKKVFDKVEDLEWKRFVAKVIQQSKATVVPVFFHGQNSRWFQLASKLHPALRLGLLLHEVLNKQGTTIHLAVGAPIEFAELAAYRDRQALLNFLYRQTFALKNIGP